MAISLAAILSRRFTGTICLPSVCKSKALHDLTHRANPEPFQPIPGKVPNFETADEAVKVVKSGDKVYVHSACATPLPLVDALVAAGRKGNLKNVEIIHILTAGPAHYNDEEFKGVFRSNNMFVGRNARSAVNEGRADYMPIFLSEIPLLFRRNIVQLDVALIQVSPPDQHGYCSLGISVDCTRAAIKNAKHIIGLANNNYPRTFGDSNIHYSHFDSLVHLDHPLPEVQESLATDAEVKISKIIAENLVDNGATIQLGIGGIPSYLCQYLKSHTDLGVHTELLTDGVVDLVDVGAVTNAQKNILTGKIAAGFAMGTAKLYNFVNNNPFVAMTAIEYINNVNVIAQNPKVTAINCCFEIDITGQVVSDSIGNYIYSGVGGQIDFLRGAASCKDGLGKPILAMPSTTTAGESKIVKYIRQGAGVVTSRAHVHYLVTEYGIAYLFGKNLRQRAHALIQVAHPDHREMLEKAAFDRLNCMPSP